MVRMFINPICAVIVAGFVWTTLAGAQDLNPIKLPEPQMTGGRPLMDVLKDRKSTRSFAETKLSEQTLSDLLWAAWGINRPKGYRTAPSAVNQQEIDVYVALAEGLFLYDAKSNTLQPVLAADLRAASGTQPFVKDAPVNLIFVADYGRKRYKNARDQFHAAANTGYISQNVYLYCASEGLGTVVRGMVDRESLAKKMNLRPDQEVILCQSVGYPK